MTTDDPVIRSADQEDLVSVYALVHRAYRGASGLSSWSHEGDIATGERISRSALARLTVDPEASLLVAEMANTIVGSVLVQATGQGGCEISLLSVDPNCQGHGLGDALLRRAEREGAGRFGARSSVIEVLEHKTKLLSYYERRGYRRTGIDRPYPYPLSKPARFLVLDKEISSVSFMPL